MGCLKTHIEWEPNLRLVYSKKGQKPLKNRINYYPFGLDHNYGLNAPMSIISGRDHKWKYNGQEQMKDLGVNVTEMTFRQYDNALGRFHGIDALAATEPHRTPYHFGRNNPIVFSDPSGLKVEAPSDAYLFTPGGYTPYAYDRNTPHWTETLGIGGGGASSGGGSSSGSNGGITNGFAAIVGLHSDANGNIISNGSYEAIGNGFLSDGTNFVDLFDGEIYDLNPVDIGVVKNRFTGFSDEQTSTIHNSVIGQLSGGDSDSHFSTIASGSIGAGSLYLGARTHNMSNVARAGKFTHSNGKAYSQNYKGGRWHTKASIAASKGKFNGALKFAARASKGLAGLSIISTGIDISQNGLKASHVADVGITVLFAFGPVGWGVGAAYFVVDMATIAITDKSITQNLLD